MIIPTSFDLQDKLWSLFVNDTQLMALMGNPSTVEEKNNRFRREDQLMDVITASDVDFLAFYFPEAMPVNNYLVNKGILQIDYYCGSRYNASLISKRVGEIISKNFDIKRTYEGQKPSGIVGIYKYRERYTPIIWS